MSANRIPGTNTPQDTDGVFHTLWRLLAATNSFASNLGTLLTTFASRFPTRAQGAAYASAIRTATSQSADITTGGASGIGLFIQVTVAGTGTLTFKLLGKDPVSGNYLVIGSVTGFTAITGSTYASFGLGAGGISGAAGSSGGGAVLPDIIAVQASHTDGSNWTYSVGYAKA